MPKDDKIDVRKVQSEFQEEEKKSGCRKGTFKIHGTFNEAMKKILKAAPEPKKRKREGGK